MADILVQKIFHKEPFSWNIPGVDDSNKARKKYLLALREADKNNYSALLLGTLRLLLKGRRSNLLTISIL